MSISDEEFDSISELNDLFSELMDSKYELVQSEDFREDIFKILIYINILIKANILYVNNKFNISNEVEYQNIKRMYEILEGTRNRRRSIIQEVI